MKKIDSKTKLLARITTQLEELFPEESSWTGLERLLMESRNKRTVKALSKITIIYKKV